MHIRALSTNTGIKMFMLHFCYAFVFVTFPFSDEDIGPSPNNISSELI